MQNNGRVLEIDRPKGIAPASPSPRRGPCARLIELLSSVCEVRVPFLSASSSVRILHTLLAGLTGVVWAFSLARLSLSTGWSAVFYLGYAAASAGFTIFCALVALDILGSEKGS